MARPDEIEDLAEQLVEQSPETTRPAGVYIIYDGTTDEPLYVGETKNVYQRLFDHHTVLQSDTLRERVDADPDLVRDTARGAMWDWTEWSWIKVHGTRSERKQVERTVEALVEPRYASN